VKTYLARDTGRRFVLADHSPAEWAELTQERLLALGCSQEYAERAAYSIATAVEAHAAGRRA
jgi:hypothetical protein